MSAPAVGDTVELIRLVPGTDKTRWEPVRVAAVNDGLITFETPTGQRPTYGLKDEGDVWRRP